VQLLRRKKEQIAYHEYTAAMTEREMLMLGGTRTEGRRDGVGMSSHCEGAKRPWQSRRGRDRIATRLRRSQ